MRIKPTASFPHPVLAESTGDYADSKFQISLTVQENLDTGQAMLDGTMSLDDPSINFLIANGHAKAGLMITCQDTYLDCFEEFPPGAVRFDLSGGRLRGTVIVRGVVVAAQNGVQLKSNSISSEFPPEARVVQTGNIIALTEELRFEAGLEKLAPLESIFRLKLHEDVTDGIFQLDLDSEAIDILVASGLHGFLSILRGQPMRDTLLSSLFLPVVMSVLEAMRAEEAYAERRWYGVMSARCNAEGVDVKNGDLADIAQKLLDAPLGSMQRVFERVSE